MMALPLAWEERGETTYHKKIIQKLYIDRDCIVLCSTVFSTIMHALDFVALVYFLNSAFNTWLNNKCKVKGSKPRKVLHFLSSESGLSPEGVPFI